MNVLNPITNQTLAVIDVDTLESVMTKLTRAKTASLGFALTSLDDRLSIISTFKSLLLQNIDSLAIDLTNEVGKPLSESRNEINSSIAKLDYFLNEAEQILESKTVHTDGTTDEIIDYDPLGVICNISAWNYPYLVGFNIFIPALIAGNAVLYKPSEYASLTGQNIAKLLHEAGVPEDIFIAIYGDGIVGTYLLDLPLDGYFFTGSYQTGQYISKRIASKLVPVGLELGGKDPLYVTDEIDNIKSVAESAASGVFYNNGQSCCSIERIYVHEKVYDEFLIHFINEVKSMKVGDPHKEETQLGAITRPNHILFLLAQIEDAIHKGAKLECGGEQVGDGPFLAPTILTNVNHTMDIMKDESFGPVIGVMKVEDDLEAKELMNDTDFGLTSSVYTNNITRGKSIIKSLDTGTGYINCCDRVSPWLPWSGRRHSGIGSTLSEIGLISFCSPRGYHIRKN
ncbi:MAG: aldehyde dehydrogenase family protein [Bacteriovoracaceae bacterium]|jgi:acyl-CoA reductase-like NAD-dependent aldehyde dehydrogenase|nr:aldehyde dehydrogenase family protein [Bacteriovoracaceae bacterium]